MASPKVHIATTVPFVLLEAVLSSESLLLKVLRSFIILFAGIGIDLDHVTKDGIKEVIRNWREKKKDWKLFETLNFKLFSGWINQLHTWKALMLFGVFSWFLQSPFPFAVYLLHIFLDGANCWNEIEDESPLPRFFYHRLFQFLGWTYIGPKEWLGKPFKEWKQEYEEKKDKS